MCVCCECTECRLGVGGGFREKVSGVAVSGCLDGRRHSNEGQKRWQSVGGQMGNKFKLEERIGEGNVRKKSRGSCVLPFFSVVLDSADVVFIFRTAVVDLCSHKSMKRRVTHSKDK